MTARPTAAGIAFIRWLVTPVARVFFRPRAEGWEKLPAGPCLIVANHSGGGVADVLSLATLWLAKHGTDRPVTGLAHPLAFLLPGVGHFLRAIGAVPSTYEDAQKALACGTTVLVFPGGDHEAYRPIWQAYRVDFGGRRGFLRLARRAWVPIVPLGIRGSHFTVPILWRSKALPWLLVLPRLAGIKRLPVTVLWVAGLATIAASPLSWRVAALVAYLWSLFPLTWNAVLVPWTVRIRFGDAIPPEELFSSRDEDGPLDAAFERVEGAVQSLVR